MGEDRLEEIAAVVDALVAGESAKTLTVEGDGALARIAGGLNALTKRRLGGPEDQALFARGPVVVFRWRNAEGWPVEFVSENVEALTGHPVEEFRSGRLPYASLVHAEDMPRVGQEVADNAASAEWFEHEPYRIHHADGRILWVYDYTVVLRDDEGNATHFYGYIMDITDRVARDELIRQQEAMIDNLGAPILQVWRGVLAVPLIGLLNNERASQVTDALLARVSETQARTAILDLTGVDVIDTSTAHHLGRMIRAVGLLGCECVISGMSASVAQIVVGLEIDFRDFRIFRTLAAALSDVLDDGKKRR
ncbi:MAG: PAS domain-containing protein [Myxococcales bacterium]|nr:PAS domain-containing protein [Myxococcales bacterium]